MIEEVVVRDILQKIQRSRKSEITKKNMFYLLRKFAYMQEVTELSNESIQYFIDYHEEKGYLKQSSIVSYAKTLASIYFIYTRRKADLDYYKPIGESIGAHMIPADVLDRFIYDYIYPLGVRVYTTILFLRGSGIRVGELTNIKKKDFFQIDGKIFCRLYESKTHTKRVVFIPNREVATEVYLYATRHLENEARVFLKPNSVKAILNRMNRLLPEHYKISSHTFRKVFVKELFDYGYTVQEIMNMTGHKTFESLAKYTVMDSKSLIDTNSSRYFN